MSEPQVGKCYLLVCVMSKHVELAEYTRCADGSVVIVEGKAARGSEYAPGEWAAAWADLMASGYIELKKARGAGLIPMEWGPRE